ncbi:fimbrial protein [Pantoea endophytica]|uniref:Fimbrial protein n=1 Tax=Pantoea sp. BJ2 TaxID=3141322 RepID=A0AAU7U496_9GAMM
MMKKSILAAAIILSSVGNSAFAVQDATITFTGKVTATTCDVSSGGDQEVNFGLIAADSFKGVGTPGAEVPFSIKLSGCESISQATATFDGQADSTDKTLIANTATDGAEGVAFAIYEADKTTKIDLNTESKPVAVDQGGNIEMKFWAKPVATAETINNGDLKGQAVVNILYK